MVAGASRVRIAARLDVSRVAAVLARAFFDDQIYRWIVPNDDQRRVGARRFFEVYASACEPHGAVYLAREDAGAALWLPPERSVVDDDHAEEFGARLMETSGDASSAARMAAMAEAQDVNHPAEPCWYLPFMGVDPGRQGTGVGSALLAAVLSRIDAEGASAYLEASSPANQRLYQRHGFVTVGEIVVLDAPPIYPMWREGQPLN